MRGLKLASLAVLLLAGAAQADISGTATAVSDYDFRGVTLSGKDPAVQGSIDWSHDSGFYAGAWGSTSIDFGQQAESDFEIDLYLGIAGGEEGGFGWDAGIVYYTYWPDDDNVEYPEIYFGGSYGMFSAKFWYTDDYANLDEDAYYLEGNADFELPENFTLQLHAGYSFGDYWEDINGDEALDFAVGLGYTLGHFDLGLKYVDTESDVDVTSDVFNNEGRVIFSIATSFPWGSE